MKYLSSNNTHPGDLIMSGKDIYVCLSELFYVQRRTYVQYKQHQLTTFKNDVPHIGFYDTTYDTVMCRL